MADNIVIGTNISDNPHQATQDMILQFLPSKTEDVIMVVSSLILTILFFVAAYWGARLSWYEKLKKDGINSWALAALWVVASVISYGTFYFTKDKNDKLYGQSRLLPYFLIISFLNLLWIIIFYYAQSFTGALGIIGVIFAAQFYIMLFLLNIIGFWAVVLLLPLQILYGYLFYSILHTASINNIPL